MSSRYLLFLLAAVAAFWIAGARGGAQQPSVPAATPSPTLPGDQTEQGGTVFIREVRVPITVLDKNKKPVAGLTRENFQVFEDKKLQTIVSFRDEKDQQPLYAVIMMDTSPSTSAKLRFQQDAANIFIGSVARERKDQMAFATFDDEIKLRQDFTQRLDAVRRAVDAPKTPGKQTALYDAIYQFCDEKMYNLPGRRVIVMITDGEDTYSRATVQEAIEIAQRTDTTIYIVSTKNGLSSAVPGVDRGLKGDAGDKIIQRLAEETGGEAFFTDKLPLEQAFDAIANQLHTQYVASYVPTNNRYDGSKRQIEVKLVNADKNLKLRAKPGYQAIAPRF
jgi:Ca-activated chloride channel family protein